MNTPDWSKAPEGATHWGPENRDWREVWYKIDKGQWFAWVAGAARQWSKARTVDDEWTDREEALMPRPTQWRGPQDGLPPVNCEVKIRLGHDWFAAKVIAHGFDHRGPVAVFQAIDWIAIRNNEDDGVRPIQSDRHRAIADMVSILKKESIESNEEAAAELYDAGYRKP